MIEQRGERFFVITEVRLTGEQRQLLKHLAALTGSTPAESLDGLEHEPRLILAAVLRKLFPGGYWALRASDPESLKELTRALAGADDGLVRAADPDAHREAAGALVAALARPDTAACRAAAKAAAACDVTTGPGWQQQLRLAEADAKNEERHARMKKRVQAELLRIGKPVSIRDLRASKRLPDDAIVGIAAKALARDPGSKVQLVQCGRWKLYVYEGRHAGTGRAQRANRAKREKRRKLKSGHS